MPSQCVRRRPRCGGAVTVRSRPGAGTTVEIWLPCVAGMQGPELVQRLVALRPEMKVLHTSGYTDDAMLRHGVASNSVQFLGKPWSIGDLRRKVREVLDG